MLGKADWNDTKQAFLRWWDGKGMLIWLTAGLDAQRAGMALDYPNRPDDPETYWTDADYRVRLSEYRISYTDYLGESFPFVDAVMGPGSLGIILGSKPGFDFETVWYYPWTSDPQPFGSIRFDPRNNHWLDVHLAIVDEGLRRAQGRYPVCMPDLIENLDVLSALRGDTPLLFDLTERPGWVLERLGELNQAYFEVFDLFYERIRFDGGGNVFTAFNVWGPGKTAKIQCDISAALSPAMFRKFVMPTLEEQCQWLDYSMYHLDGTTCLQHMDALLEMPSLKAIEWTPQAGMPQGGSPRWYDLYKRIKAGGKSVEVISINDDEIIPLLDAVGPEGLYIIPNDHGRTRGEAESLLKKLEPYRL